MFYRALFCLLGISWPCFSALVDEMTIEEKVGQLFMVHFHGSAINEEARRAVQDLQVGGIIYYNFSNGDLESFQAKPLSSGLQALARQTRLGIPLLIATDQEGGIVARLKKGYTASPGNLAIGSTENPDIAESFAYIMGLEMQAVGINMNLAPVVDINGCVTSSRSFGSSPEKVITFAERTLQGYHRAGLITCLKHFPGHGAATADSHYELPVVYKTQEEICEQDIVPFQALAHMTDTIMLGHLLIPSIDPKRCATLSPTIVQMLREEIGFSGVIITDSLIMQGLLQNCPSIEEATISAFEAGSDILLFGGRHLTGGSVSFELTLSDIARIQQAMLQAIKTGRIPEKRLNASVQRILDLKERFQSKCEWK